MRTVTYGGACSLDGFLTGPNEAMDWLRFSPAVQEMITDYFKTIDTLLMGRKTWDFARRQAGGGGGGGETAGITTYVFSRTLRSIDQPGVILVSENAGEFVRALKKAKGKGICVMGGGELARSLFEADVIDEVGFNVHPVLLGSGAPALPDARRRVDLDLIECRPLPKECVSLRYKVRRTRARQRPQQERS